MKVVALLFLPAFALIAACGSDEASPVEEALVTEEDEGDSTDSIVSDLDSWDEMDAPPDPTAPESGRQIDRSEVEDSAQAEVRTEP